MRVPQHRQRLKSSSAMACWPLLLVLAGGCHSTPARPSDNGNCKRGVVLAGQIVHDTGLQAVAHPIETGCMVAASAGAWVAETGHEFFAKRCLVPLGGMPAALDEERPALDPSHLEDALAHLTHRPLEPAQIKMDVDGEEALRRLEGLIAGAERSIDVLMYQWDSDALGWGIAQRLAERAQALSVGDNCAAVRILIDGGGNLIHGPPNCASAHAVNEVLLWLERQPNVAVMRTRNALARFDHRKLLVADGQIAWTGGRNFTLSSFFEYRDISFTVEGPLVRDMSASFEETWQQSGGHPRPSSAGPVPEADGVNSWARVVGTGRKRNDLARVLYRAVDKSSHHVYLENPYFTDTLLWCKLAKARRRGSDVRVVFAHDSQSRVIDKAMRVIANRLLRVGVRVYMHPGTTHVKAASVDTRWAYLGTGNFDKLSLRRNNEVGVAIGAGPLLHEVEQTLFIPDFRPEWEVTEPFPVTLGDYLCEAVATFIL